MKTIKHFILTTTANGRIFKTSVCKTKNGIRKAKTNHNLAYGAHLVGSVVVVYTDGTSEPFFTSAVAA